MLPTTFPGINMVRVDVETYSNPSTLAAAVNALTAKGIVVEFSDYTNSIGQNAGGGAGVVYTGSELATEFGLVYFDGVLLQEQPLCLVWH